ncbi:histone-like nucleoid-structuring protein Lsr2 [Modestobacter sp. SSW1-42]|uniref:histone-like nucleoid-structuring protein Lsr2 n=1 Tax=Modestobacter sp. SSW1-42 TaxID=596372 RepID=UPI0039869346
MARKVQVILSDDLDDSIPADETVTFALDGTTYEIDLSDKNASEMREVFGKYVDAARKVSSRGTRASGAGRSRATGGATGGGGNGGGRMDREQAGAIRDWARKNGHEVSDRGRIPGSVVEAYEAAH